MIFFCFILDIFPCLFYFYLFIRHPKKSNAFSPLIGKDESIWSKGTSKGKQCDEGSVYATSVLCSSKPRDLLSKKGLCSDGYILLYINGDFFEFTNHPHRGVYIII